MSTPPVFAEAPTPSSPARREVAFVDTSVNDWQTLVEGIQPGIEVVLLNGSGDGLAQMVEWAATHSGYDAIHVLSHGATGQVQLGTATLDAAALTARAAELTQLGAALKEDGDLLFYGCNVAAGQVGVEFVQRLAQVSGADVAASEDLTGAATSGGDWVLEIQGDTTQTSTLFAQGVPFGSLLEITVSGQIIRQEASGNGGTSGAYYRPSSAGSPGTGTDNTVTGGAGNDIIFADGSGGGGGGGGAGMNGFGATPGGSGGAGGSGSDSIHGGIGDDIIFADGFAGQAGSPGTQGTMMTTVPSFSPGTPGTPGAGGAGGYGNASGVGGTGSIAAGGTGQAASTIDDNGSFWSATQSKFSTLRTATTGTGADTLDGGAGSDHLFGGGGNDTFVFELNDAGASDTDTLWDFRTGDLIKLTSGGNMVASSLITSLVTAQTASGNDRSIVFTDSADKQVTILVKEIGRALTTGDFVPGASPGITLSKTSTSVTEGGVTDTYTVVLNAAPTADVTIHLGNTTEPHS